MLQTLCTLNLNGIRSAERRGFTRWLGRQRPDILCLQELRARPEDVEPEQVSPPAYDTRWLPAEKKGYAGVALFARSGPDRWCAGTDFEHCKDEGRVLRADWHDLSVVSLYVPSGSSSPERLRIKLRYLELLEAHLAALIREDHKVALCGDINIAPTALDLARPKQNEKNSGFLPVEREWFARILAQGWVDVVRAQHPGKPGLYSWWSQRGQARAKDIGWRLDHVLCSPALARSVRRAWIESKAGLSDHAPVWIEYER
jgi:exodeoxyribonuclease-3